MAPHPDAAAFWDRQLEQAAGHERDLARRHDRIGLALTVLGGVGSAGLALAMQAAGTWAALGTLADLLVAFGLLVAALAAGVSGVGLTPMDGRGWRPGSLPAWVRDRSRLGLQVEALAGLFPDRDDDWRSTLRRASRVRDDLPGKIRAALEAREGSTVATSPDARRILADWLGAALHADLAWWLEPADDTPDSIRAVETRIRLVFWFWAQRQVAEARADGIRLALRLGTWAAGLVASAFAVHLLGWWILAVVVGIAALILLRLLLGRTRDL